jgi:hypothetical protein
LQLKIETQLGSFQAKNYFFGRVGGEVENKANLSSILIEIAS